MAVIKIVRRSAEPARNVVNHAGRGDNRKTVTAEDELNYEMPLEELREKADQQLQGSHWKSVGMRAFAELGVFLQDHPELAAIDVKNDATATRNRDAFIAELQKPENIMARRRAGRVGLTEYSYADWQNAYERLVVEGKLVLDANEMYKKEEAAARVRARQFHPGDNDPETMPMHQLRALANRGASIDHDPLGPKY
jgi:hypothetical protein